MLFTKFAPRSSRPAPRAERRSRFTLESLEGRSLQAPVVAPVSEVRVELAIELEVTLELDVIVENPAPSPVIVGL